MFGLRSARGRAILAATVPLLLVVVMGALAVWRARDDEQLHETLDRTSAAATALEGAQAGFWQAQGALSALVISGDPAFVDDYDGALAAADQNLAKARAEFLTMGKTAEVSALDNLANRIGEFNQTVRWFFPLLVEADRQAAIELADASVSELTASTEAIVVDLQGMVREAQQEASAERETADRAADVTLLLLLGLSGAALATGIGAVVMLVGSVVRPLAALRASARAIASGELQARARVFGPEEVASLARDFNDMTDALAAKTEASQESERRYRLLAENASDIIWTMDMNLRFTYESPSITRIRGYTPEEAMAQSIEETLTPASLELAMRALTEELALEAMERDPRTLELEHTCKDGSTVWLEVTTTFLRDEDGRLVGLLGASRDISERKRAEEELEESRRLLENVTQGITEGILLLSKDFEILWANNAVLEETGCEMAQVLGNRCYEITHRRESPCDDRLHPCPIHEAQRTGQPVTVTHAHFDAAGGEHVTEVAAYPVGDDNGEIVQFVHVSRDVTERRKVQAALEESERRYRLIAENARDIIWTTDMNLRYTYVSPSFARVRGYSTEEAMAKTIRDTLTPPSLELAAKVLAEELAIEKMEQKDLNRSRTLELEVKNKDGSTVWTEVRVAFLRDSDGRPVGLLGVSRDIAERKRAEDALRESEGLYRDLYEDAPTAYFSIGVDGRVLRCNRKAQELLGYTSEQLVGMRVLNLYSDAPDGKERARSVLRRFQAGEPATNEQLEMRRADGEPIWISLSVTPLRDAVGNVVSSRSVVVDITERKRAEEALRESEERFRLLFENAKDAIFHADPGTGLITKCNRAAETLLEKDQEEIIGQPQATIHPPQKAEHYTQMFKHHMEQQGFAEDEAEVMTKSGKTKPVLITASVASVRGTPIIQGVFRDITERKRAEEERERLHAELEVRAITDGLTGLYNHAHFYQRLAEETDRSNRYNHGFAVVMMDVDNFKRFNDSHGHQAGDEMLRLVADSIRSGLRRSDLAFRYGGDEFAAILLHTDAARARAVIDRINRRLAKSLRQRNDGAAARLSLSAGVACFADDGKTPDELVRVADTALYSAKWGARARYPTGEECNIEPPSPPPVMAARGMLSTTAGSLAAALRELGVPDVMAELNLRTIAALGTLAEIKDPYVRGHQERTSDVAATLAEEMGLSPDRVRGTRLAGLVHDLGKAGVSKRILRKPGKLTEEEFAEIKEHPPLGSMMIISEVEALQQLVPIVRHHHERFDGKGYPDGLAGDEIPLEARILAVVDAFDAMTHERSYRKALGREEALAEVKRGAGTQFDPAVVDVFLAWAAKKGEGPPARRQSVSEDEELAAVPTTKA